MKPRETNGGQWDLHRFHNFSLDPSSFSICICKKEKLKDETSKKIRETSGARCPINLRFPAEQAQPKNRFYDNVVQREQNLYLILSSNNIKVLT